MRTQSTAPYDGREVANYLLDLADSKKLTLTQISLLKLIYFCHGWYLFYKERPLVKNEFEAWENGPVIRVVRDSFKHHGRHAITSRADKFDLLTGEILQITPAIEAEDASFISKIFETYHGFGPWELRDLTHEAGSPWDKLWNSSEITARFGLRIRNDEILSHFSFKAKKKTV